MQTITQQAKPFDDHLLGWWYRIAAPAEVPDEAPLRDRMRVRSGRLTSVIFLVEIIFSIVGLIGSVLSSPFSIPLVLTMLTVLIVGTILNRRGKTVLAGVIVIVFLTGGLALGIFFTPGGLTPSLLPIFDFFAIDGLIAASLPTPWLALPITLFDCLFTVGALTFLPRSPEIAKLMLTQPFTTYADPLEIQIIVSIVTFLWVSSTYREMNRANSAEEVNKLTMELAMQQQTVLEGKQQLEESIQQIVEVHMQAANGNLNARVPLNQQNVLWSIAGSLNNLLARLQRWRYDAMQLQQNEQALQQLLSHIQTARRHDKPLQVYATGTSLDALILEISKGIATPQQPSNRDTKREFWASSASSDE